MSRCDSFFFFQAEDGIRDYKVTGVQTCALPISEVSELHRGLSLGIATPPATLVLAELRFLREQHQLSAFSCLVGSSVCCFGVVVSGASATGAGVVSTCGSTGGCSRPSADVAVSSVRGFSTLSCLPARFRGAGLPPRPPRPPPWPVPPP